MNNVGKLNDQSCIKNYKKHFLILIFDKLKLIILSCNISF